MLTPSGISGGLAEDLEKRYRFQEQQLLQFLPVGWKAKDLKSCGSQMIRRDLVYGSCDIRRVGCPVMLQVYPYIARPLGVYLTHSSTRSRRPTVELLISLWFVMGVPRWTRLLRPAHFRNGHVARVV